jgi:hypothetical protein
LPGLYDQGSVAWTLSQFPVERIKLFLYSIEAFVQTVVQKAACGIVTVVDRIIALDARFDLFEASLNICTPKPEPDNDWTRQVHNENGDKQEAPRAE